MYPRALLTLLALTAFSAAGATSPVLDKQFTQTVKPFVTKYCVVCHSGEAATAALDLRSFSSVDAVAHDYSRWVTVAAKLTAQQMPPKQMPQPPAEDRQKVIDWIRAFKTDEIKRNAGDPGVVLARRLSNAEYNYTIRDLTGVDMKPTREFPVDPANPEGFDNSGESLTMSPALLKKYLTAAREVGDHMVLTPDGFDFSPYPMLVETDREKYAIQRIVQFYFSQPTDYADYFEAAWEYRNRAALGKPNATLASIANDMKISVKYLSTVWGILEQKEGVIGPIAKLQGMWKALPAPGDAKPEAPRTQCEAMRDFAVKIRQHTAMQFTAPTVKGLPGASAPLLNWKLGMYAAHRRDSDPKDLLNDDEPAPAVPTIPRRPGLHQEAAPYWAAVSAKARAGDPDLIVPHAERAKYEAAFERFANVFPDGFYVTERGRYFPDDTEDKGRLLSAGYHSVVGYYRDDTALKELILDEQGQKRIDRLWDEFDFIANQTARTWEQYFFNNCGEVYGKGAEAECTRPEGHQIYDTAVIMKLRGDYIAKAKADPKSDPLAQEAILDHFGKMDATLRGLEKEHTDAEPKHLDALLRFAARAYRRPLTKAEHDDILAYYHSLRDKDALSHEDAIRQSIVSILMEPDFSYRIDLAPATTSSQPRPLSGPELASRLSYFLWSSMPDDELMKHAAAGDLHKPAVLLAQTRRMLEDKRSMGLATEFGGNMLDFRRFETYNSADRERFPAFTNDLREAMFQEPIRYLTDLFQNNRSVLDLLYGNYTFVNPTLAKFYGMPEVKGKDDNWVRVDDAAKYQRGGLLPMAVFQTQNSPGLRTSPVKRGYWVVRRVLGEVIPPPPPVVPELPADESKTDLPLRDVLAQHRSNPLCAQCHARFDVFGLAFENFGPVGGARTKDLAGRPVDISTTFPDGSTGSGYEGVLAYIKGHRQQDFLDNMSRKLLAYALNRSLLLSDEGLIERMNTRMAANGYKIETLVDAIVTSPQFLNKRGSEQGRQSTRKNDPQPAVVKKGE